MIVAFSRPHDPRALVSALHAAFPAWLHADPSGMQRSDLTFTSDGTNAWLIIPDGTDLLVLRGVVNPTSTTPPGAVPANVANAAVWQKVIGAGWQWIG